MRKTPTQPPPKGTPPRTVVGYIHLRDWFAGQALAGKAMDEILGYETGAPEHRAELIERIVNDCYEISDGMMRRRESTTFSSS